MYVFSHLFQTQFVNFDSKLFIRLLEDVPKNKRERESFKFSVAWPYFVFKLKFLCEAP